MADPSPVTEEEALALLLLLVMPGGDGVEPGQNPPAEEGKDLPKGGGDDAAPETVVSIGSGTFNGVRSGPDADLSAERAGLKISGDERANWIVGPPDRDLIMGGAGSDAGR